MRTIVQVEVYNITIYQIVLNHTSLYSSLNSLSLMGIGFSRHVIYQNTLCIRNILHMIAFFDRVTFIDLSSVALRCSVHTQAVSILGLDRRKWINLHKKSESLLCHSPPNDQGWIVP